MSVLEKFISKCRLPLTVFFMLGLGAITARASTEVSGQVKDYVDKNPVANAKITEETESKSVFADLDGLYSILLGNQAPVVDSNLVLEGSVGDSLEKNLGDYFSDDQPDSLLSFILRGNDGFSYSIRQDGILKVKLEQEGTDSFKITAKDEEGDSAVMNTYADIQPNGGITEEESKNIDFYSSGSNVVLEDKNGLELKIGIYDILGRKIEEKIKGRSENKVIIDVSNFSQGKHFVKLQKGNEGIGTGNFIVMDGNAVFPSVMSRIEWRI